MFCHQEVEDSRDEKSLGDFLGDQQIGQQTRVHVVGMAAHHDGRPGQQRAVDVEHRRIEGVPGQVQNTIARTVVHVPRVSAGTQHTAMGDEHSLGATRGARGVDHDQRAGRSQVAGRLEIP